MTGEIRNGAVEPTSAPRHDPSESRAWRSGLSVARGRRRSVRRSRRWPLPRGRGVVLGPPPSRPTAPSGPSLVEASPARAGYGARRGQGCRDRVAGLDGNPPPAAGELGHARPPAGDDTLDAFRCRRGQSETGRGPGSRRQRPEGRSCRLPPGRSAFDDDPGGRLLDAAAEVTFTGDQRGETLAIESTVAGGSTSFDTAETATSGTVPADPDGDEVVVTVTGDGTTTEVHRERYDPGETPDGSAGLAAGPTCGGRGSDASPASGSPGVRPSRRRDGPRRGCVARSGAGGRPERRTAHIRSSFDGMR